MGIFDWFKRQMREDPDDDSPDFDEDWPTEQENPPTKRLTEELWVRLMDLPGFEEWAKDFDRPKRMVGVDFEEFRLLVHPRDIEAPPPGFFDRVCQDRIDSIHEHFAHLDLPRHTIDDYKKGGKFFEKE